MKATAENIWRVPAYLPYLQPTLTDDSIEEAEQKLGFVLPSEFLDLLRTQNGGYIKFSLPESVHNKIAGIGPNFPSLTDFDWDECQEYMSFKLHGLVPFDGDGHWHLCLDYRENTAFPTVTHVDIECDRQLPIATSFSEYLALLEIEFHNEFVIEPEGGIESTLNRLAEALAITFSPPDWDAHGFPIYRVALGTASNPQWLWLSPNHVNRGFVRTTDPRYETLKSLLPGKVSRFPEISTSSYLLSTSDEVREKVHTACIACGFNIQPLHAVAADKGI